MKQKITASIVLFNTDQDFLQKLITSFEDEILLYLVDNSNNDTLSIISSNFKNVKYVHNPINIGFGAAHNIAIRLAMNQGSTYHFVVNPDIIVDKIAISKMILQMESDHNIGMLMPKILNLDGSIQFLPKLLPNPFSILMRKIKFPNFIFVPFIEKYELRKYSKNITFNTPVISGCFTLINMNAIKKVGIYDENYFMYFEDWDLSRRMSLEYKTLYFPEAFVTHLYYSGANKKFKLLLIYIKSYIHYFNKWGWLKDHKRVKMNNLTLNQFNKSKINN